MIVGIDLSGPPDVDGAQYAPLLKEAREAGLKTALHLAEVRLHFIPRSNIIFYRTALISQSLIHCCHCATELAMERL